MDFNYWVKDFQHLKSCIFIPSLNCKAFLPLDRKEHLTAMKNHTYN
jgi:hypothetical protein